MQKMIKRGRQTKIVATLGPASTDVTVVRQLFLAGADVFRLNFSHADSAGHKPRFDAVRQVEKEFNHPVPVFADLQGPKLRLGRFENGGAEVAIGQEFVLDDNEALGNATRVHLPHPEIFAAVAAGQDLLIDDGKVRLKILQVKPGQITTQVVAGTKLLDRKGVSVPGAVLNISALSERDRKDLREAIAMGVDMIALSFVQRPEDIHEARTLIKQVTDRKIGIIAKIEKPQALLCLPEIIAATDAIMVARGDLGVEMPPEQVPGAQKRLVRLARDAGKPVIVATQMLESMIEAAVPTRAEASDVATAVFDGADAVMLSAESAAGKYPIEAVTMMNNIAAAAELDEHYYKLLHAHNSEPEAVTADAITAAARQVAELMQASAIVTFTTSGATTLRMARERPNMPILCLTPLVETARQLTLSFGVHAVVMADIKSFDEMVESAMVAARKYGMAETGDRIVMTAGVPFARPGSTNLLHVRKLP